MQTAWHGTVKDFLHAIEEERLFVELEAGYTASYGSPSPSEKNSWRHSLAHLSICLREFQLANCQIFLEVQMPVGGERADVVILGGNPDALKGVVIELKQWANVESSTHSTFVKVVGGGENLHPWYQVSNYAGKLKFYSDVGSHIAWQALVYVHNMLPEMVDRLKEQPCVQRSAQNRFFGKNDAQELARRICEWLTPTSITENEADRFHNSLYSQTHHLFDAITKFHSEIKQELSLALPKLGFGLTEEQERVCQEILAAFESNEKRHFIIDGSAGSGKTLLATLILLQALKLKEKKVVFALRGNRLHAMLKHCFDAILPGSSGCIQYFSNKRGGGLCDHNHTQTYDLIIADESQRLHKNQIKPLLDKGRVVAFFLDEKQRLNPPEEGTVASISQFCTAPIVHCLSRPARCRGGLPYHDWVDQVLERSAEPESSKLVALSNIWATAYRLQFVSSIEELIEQLKKFGNTHRTALVASFTESSGDKDYPLSTKNRRIGYPLQSGFDRYKRSSIDLRWLMDPKEYVQFWKNGRSNELNSIASIYGSQGFESDYIGLIWGRDLLWRADRGFRLGDSLHCYDVIDGLVTKSSPRQWDLDALRLVINRYRIFLTRGILGTIIYCEDDVTCDFLRSTIGSTQI